MMTSLLLRAIKIACFAILALVHAGASDAQIATALVQGAVTDESGAILPGVTVTARNEETGLTRSVVADAAGWYRIAALQPGRYEVVAELSGFATVRRQAVSLTVGQEARIDLQLRVGSLEETITVTGETPLVEVSKTALGTTVTAKEIDDLPLAGRNYINLLTMAAGVTPEGGAAGLASFGRNSGRAGYIVDGVTQTRDLFPGVQNALSPDAVQEFQILSNMFGAEYGHAGGPIVNLISRSGSNSLHGRAAVFSRNDQLDARHYFASGEAPFSQQWYVGNLGGPVVRDRIHYFGSFEGSWTDETAVVTSRLAPGEYPRSTRNIKTLSKLDWQLPRSQHLTLRASIGTNRLNNGGLGDLNTVERATLTKTRNRDYQATHTAVLSGRLLNEVRFLYASERNNIDSLFCDLCPAIIRPGGNFGKATNVAQTRHDRTIQIVDHLSFTKGEHNMKFGVDYAYFPHNIFMSRGAEGQFRFTTDLPFNPADARTYPVEFTITRGNGPLDPSDELLAWFVQDSWRVRSNLTLNAGLRYEWQGQWSLNDKNNFGPRVSFAWDTTGEGTTVVRGGTGIFYDQNRLELITTAFLTATRELQQIQIINPGYPDPFGPNPNGTRTGAPPVTLTVIDPKKRNPSSHRVTLGIVRALTPSTKLSADGVWVRGLHLIRNRDINYADPATRVRPNPAFGVITQQESSAQSRYYALETELQQRLYRNLQFTVAYTLAETKHDLDTPVSQLDFREALARVGNRHLLSASAVYQFPYGVQTALLFRARSGSPYSILTGRDDNGDTFFTDRPAGEGRNAHLGPAAWTADGRVSKSFGLGSGRRLEVLIEAFNLTNRPNFNTPENRLNSARFGEFVSMATDYTPRQVQLGARLTF